MKRPDYILDSVALAATLIQTKEVFQVVSLIITCLSFIVSIAYTIYKWYKKAKADGKITVDEVKEVIENIKEVSKK